MLSTYEESLKNLWDLNNCLETAERKGKAEGRAEGKAEGLAEGLEKGLEKGEAIGLEKGALQNNIENARKMRSKGFSVEDIEEITGLSVEEIEKL